MIFQVVDPHEVYSGTRVADPPLSEDQMIAETLALVMGDSKIWSAGTYWERNKFTNRSLFAPFAYKEQLNTRKFKVEDLARLNGSDEVYLNNEWFQFLKQRWSANHDSLEKINMKIKIRFNETGEYKKKYEVYPNFYRAASIDHGYWTRPYFDCEGKVSFNFVPLILLLLLSKLLVCKLQSFNFVSGNYLWSLIVNKFSGEEVGYYLCCPLLWLGFAACSFGVQRCRCCYNGPQDFRSEPVFRLILNAKRLQRH
jgi:hypothetical protein